MFSNPDFPPVFNVFKVFVFTFPDIFFFGRIIEFKLVIDLQAHKDLHRHQTAHFRHFTVYIELKCSELYCNVL